MKVLVTGANGYLGQGVVRRLCDLGAQVVAADFAADNIDRRAEAVTADLFGTDNPYEFFGKPDVLLHLAWRDGFVHNSDAHIADLPKHYAFIKSFVDGGVKRVCVMGTMHEVGFFEGSIDENTPCSPQSLYGICKNALRGMTAQMCEAARIPWQWLRGYYIVGNSEFGNSVFSKITAAAAQGKTEFPFTMGQNQYDFLDYEDFCIQVAAVAAQETVTGIINICSGKPEKLCDRVERFISENGYNIKLQYGKYPDRPYDSKAVWGNDSKIRAVLRQTEG